MREDIITAIFPRTGCIKKYWQSLFTKVDFPLDSPPNIATVRTKKGFTSVGIYIPNI